MRGSWGGRCKFRDEPAILFLLIQRNTYNLAEAEDVLECSRMLLKFYGKSQPRGSCKNGSHKITLRARERATKLGINADDSLSRALP